MKGAEQTFISVILTVSCHSEDTIVPEESAFGLGRGWQPFEGSEPSKGLKKGKLFGKIQTIA
jgi:hypothetical protein